jgi:hypothetical protein
MSTFYQIKVKGHLNQTWSEWFDGLTITNLEHGEAMIHGMIVDQAALYGVLIKVRDLGLTLIGVCRVADEGLSHRPLGDAGGTAYPDGSP